MFVCVRNAIAESGFYLPLRNGESDSSNSPISKHSPCGNCIYFPSFRYYYCYYCIIYIRDDIATPSSLRLHQCSVCLCVYDFPFIVSHFVYACVCVCEFRLSDSAGENGMHSILKLCATLFVLYCKVQSNGSVKFSLVHSLTLRLQLSCQLNTHMLDASMDGCHHSKSNARAIQLCMQSYSTI